MYLFLTFDDGFHHAVCWLPEYTWTDIEGFSESEMQHYEETIVALGLK